METVKRVSRAVVDVTLRIVIKANFSDKTIDDVIDNFLNRALQADIPPELYTEGLIAAQSIDHRIIHEWEEIDYEI